MSRRGASREGRKLGEGGWPVPPRRCFSHQRMAHVCVQRQRRDIHCESATGRIRRGEPGAQPQELRQENARAEGAIHAQKEFLRNQFRGCSIETRLQRVVMGTAIGSWSVAPGSNVRGRLTRFAFGRIPPVFCAKGAIPSRAWATPQESWPATERPALKALLNCGTSWVQESIKARFQRLVTGNPISWGDAHASMRARLWRLDEYAFGGLPNFRLGTREGDSRVPAQSFWSCSYGRGGGVG